MQLRADVVGKRRSLIVIGAGSAHGVFMEMRLCLGPRQELARVILVDDETCVASFETPASSAPPEIGWRCSSR